MGPRGAGRRLNDQERMEILDTLARETKVKNVDLAKRYGVSEGAIRKLKQVKDRIRDRYFLGNEHNRDKRKRGGFARNAQFEQELYDWILRMREAQAYQLMPLTQTAVRQQAMLLAQKYERMSAFKASPGWFARFCSRHRLDPPMTSTTAGAAAAASASAALSAASASVLEVSAMAVAVGADQAKDDFLPVLVDADALMADVKHETDEELKCSETIDEQTKIAARQHNEVALSIAKAAAAATSAALDLSVGSPGHANNAIEDKSGGLKAVNASVAAATGVASTTTATTTTVSMAASSIASATAVSEDEIFSLGL